MDVKIIIEQLVYNLKTPGKHYGISTQREC